MAFDPGARRAGFAAFHPGRKRFHLYNVNPLRVKIEGEWRQVKYYKVEHNWWLKFAKAWMNRFDCYLRKARMIIVEQPKGARMSYFIAQLLGMLTEAYPKAFVYEMNASVWRNYCGAKAERVKVSSRSKRVREQMQHSANKIQSSRFMRETLGSQLYDKACAKFGIKTNAKENVDAFEAMMMTIAAYGLESELKAKVDKVPSHSEPKKGEVSERRIAFTFDPHDILARHQKSSRKRVQSG